LIVYLALYALIADESAGCRFRGGRESAGAPVSVAEPGDILHALIFRSPGAG